MSVFSVKDDDPFIVFRALQEIARNAKGADVVDLSRGDPGYGFTPSARGRMFASYILFLDSVLSSSAEKKISGEEETKSLYQCIEEVTRATYQPQSATTMRTLLREFVACSLRAAREEGREWTEGKVLMELFLGSAMSGGTYLRPEGEELTRVIVAAWHRGELQLPITSADIILTNGASHAIGALFKALGEEGCGYLTAGDTVAIASPVYAPYNRILEERKLRVVTLSIDPLNGHIDLSPLQQTPAPPQHYQRVHGKQRVRGSASKPANQQTSKPPKALFLINPHNPTGFSLASEALRDLAEIARAREMLIVCDEVYTSFFPEKLSMLQFCPERTIAIGARSKVERATGLRFGEIITLPRGREHIANMLGLRDAAAFERLLTFAKAPGRCGGQFQHTTFVPGPSQLLGIAHIVLGSDERRAYIARLRENQSVFQGALGLPHRGNLYYVIFDLNALPECRTRDLPMEDKLTALAEAGVIYLPAYRFFSASERGKPGALTSVRASLVNASAERLREAAQRTKEVLC